MSCHKFIHTFLHEFVWKWGKTMVNHQTRGTPVSGESIDYRCLLHRTYLPLIVYRLLGTCDSCISDI